MLEWFAVFYMHNLKVHYNSDLLYFSSQTSMEQPHMIDHPKTLYRGKDRKLHSSPSVYSQNEVLVFSSCKNGCFVEPSALLYFLLGTEQAAVRWSQREEPTPVRQVLLMIHASRAHSIIMEGWGTHLNTISSSEVKFHLPFGNICGMYINVKISDKIFSFLYS